MKEENYRSQMLGGREQDKDGKDWPWMAQELEKLIYYKWEAAKKREGI